MVKNLEKQKEIGLFSLEKSKMSTPLKEVVTCFVFFRRAELMASRSK